MDEAVDWDVTVLRLIAPDTSDVKLFQEQVTFNLIDYMSVRLLTFI